ncbi:hypothetical protein CEXT_556071 [Caerostris extrusa]|uniref:Uncharacterized protein n=1 Tax=Caerostris extrusa TaxID=172846 RepID=A0AAV4RPY4_CAEEX|nr:hypothetical protein CEXT_556071 [Caerostris extrusa]
MIMIEIRTYKQSILKVARHLELYHDTSIMSLPMCPLDYTHLNINHEFTMKVLKRDMIPKQLKSIDLEAIEADFQKVNGCIFSWVVPC